MAVIKKRADELKPGDVLVDNGHTVASTGPSGQDTVKIHTAQGIVLHSSAESVIDVLMPDLTPAQQHADALLAFVEAAADSPARTGLLDKVHPPALPTLNEVMTTLAGLTDPAVTAAEIKRRIEALVAKARRAGWGA